MTSFERLVQDIRLEQGPSASVPSFDPSNGNEEARFLFLLEAPGPKAVKSGMISLENQDPSARRFKAQLDEAGIIRDEIAIWNLIPWYLGNADMSRIRPPRSEEIKMALPYLEQLIRLMPNLTCIVLVGSEAAKAHVYLSARTPLRMVRCHHPSAQSTRATCRQH